MPGSGERSSNPSYRLFELLALVSLGGLLAFVVADRTLLVGVLTGRDLYARHLAVLCLPIMVSSAGALALFKSSFGALQRQAEAREAARQQHVAELERTYQSVMFALVAALDSRDHLARGHSRRVVGYALAIADRLGLAPAEKRDLAFGGYLHDVGKIGVGDALLRKPTTLSEGEWKEMRRHPVIGHEILLEVDFLGGASDVVLSHHEHFDGEGYPAGIRGTNIPLLARVFAVADAFDAMTADRPYRQALSSAAARAVIAEQAGRQFCPLCVQAFLTISEGELQEIGAAAQAGRREDLWQEWHRMGVESPG